MECIAFPKLEKVLVNSKKGRPEMPDNRDFENNNDRRLNDKQRQELEQQRRRQEQQKDRNGNLDNKRNDNNPK